MPRIDVTPKAPIDAKYIVQTADDILTAEQALGALSTGLMKVTTSTGAITTASAGDVPDLSATYAVVDQTMYIGTTAVDIDRTSGALTLAGLTLTTPNIGTPSAGVLTNCSGTASSLTAGAVTGFTPASGSLTLSGADAVTITTTGATNSTLPLGTKTLVATDVATLSSLTSVGTIGTGTWEATDVGTAHGGTGASSLAAASIPTYTSTITFTNKRITPRVTTEASAAEPTINTDNSDAHSITALAAAITSMTTNLSGTPTNFQKLLIRILDNGTGRAIAWGASFEDNGVALPATTTANKLLTVGFIYDTASSKWGCVAVADET